MSTRRVRWKEVFSIVLPKIEAFEKRMGWTFKWLSSDSGDFNYDLGASFRPEEVASGVRAYNFGTMQPGFTDREGLVLHDIRVADRPLIYRASVAEMVVPYADPSPVRGLRQPPCTLACALRCEIWGVYPAAAKRMQPGYP